MAFSKLIERLKSLIFSGDFTIPKSQRSLPECLIRPVQESDFEYCLNIYRGNEDEHFPAGYLQHFSAWLRSPRDLILVAEASGQVCAFGGISIIEDSDNVSLAFGMVHPKRQKQGFGTVLLLSRLHVLPPPEGVWLATLTCVGNSASFYRRFGFVRYSTIKHHLGAFMDVYYTRVDSTNIRACSNMLTGASVSVELGGASVPVTPPLQKPENWSGLQRRNQSPGL